MISRNLIINSAKEVGFDLVGVVSSETLSQERERFNEWLARGYHSTLSYLERNGDKRFTPALLAEGTKSVIVCGVSYLSPYSRGYDKECATKVASYALARDYHLTIKEMLRELAERLTLHHPDLRFRAFTDSAPLAEKSLAIKAGFGWIGRNSLVVNPHFGTMFNLGELLISEEVDGYDSPMQGYGCGTCRRCVDSCPNGAIRGTQAVASAVFMANHGETKDAIRNYLSRKFRLDLDYSIADIKAGYSFDSSTNYTVPPAIVAFLDSADYESAVRNAVSLGGDADTMACIAGGIAEAFYGEIPEELKNFCYSRLDYSIKSVAIEFCRKYKISLYK